MPQPLSALEGALAQAAEEFARKLLDAIFRAPTAELAQVFREGISFPRPSAGEPLVAGRSAATPAPKKPSAPVARPRVVPAAAATPGPKGSPRAPTKLAKKTAPLAPKALPKPAPGAAKVAKKAAQVPKKASKPAPVARPAVPAKSAKASAPKPAIAPKRSGAKAASSVSAKQPSIARQGAPQAARQGARQGARKAPPLDTFDDDRSTNVITDPTSLLDVLNRQPSTARPASSTRSSRSEAPAAQSKGSSAGPALRAGERVQRTAGGAVVLRRGRK